MAVSEPLPCPTPDEPVRLLPATGSGEDGAGPCGAAARPVPGPCTRSRPGCPAPRPAYRARNGMNRRAAPACAASPSRARRRPMRSSTVTTSSASGSGRPTRPRPPARCGTRPRRSGCADGSGCTRTRPTSQPPGARDLAELGARRGSPVPHPDRRLDAGAGAGRRVDEQGCERAAHDVRAASREVDPLHSSHCATVPVNVCDAGPTPRTSAPISRWVRSPGPGRKRCRRRVSTRRSPRWASTGTGASVSVAEVPPRA